MVFDTFWVLISYFADIAYWIGFAVSFLIIYPLLEKKDKIKVFWIIYALLPAVFLAYSLNFILKSIFQIERPCVMLSNCPSGYSFPSGHASLIFAFATIVTIYEKKYKSYLWAIPLAILVGLSRIFLNYHTVADVIGGAFVGIFSAIVVFKLSKNFKNLFYSIEKFFHKILK
jgi:undecaprenyl-diphosphatase